MNPETQPATVTVCWVVMVAGMAYLQRRGGDWHWHYAAGKADHHGTQEAAEAEIRYVEGKYPTWKLEAVEYAPQPAAK